MSGPVRAEIDAIRLTPPRDVHWGGCVDSKMQLAQSNIELAKAMHDLARVQLLALKAQSALAET